MLGRQILDKSLEAMQSELFPDRSFGQHPYRLDCSQMGCVLPGGVAQGLHVDGGKHIMDMSRLGLQPSLSTMWAVTEFTSEVGATAVVKGSRHCTLTASRVCCAWLIDRLGLSGPRARRPLPTEAVTATMSSGSCLVFTSDTWHGAGQNSTADRTRVGLNASYSLSWLAQEENQFLAVPPETARNMPRALLQLAGFRCPSGSLGYVCGGRDPLDAAQGVGRVESGWDWAAPLASQRGGVGLGPGDPRAVPRL